MFFRGTYFHNFRNLISERREWTLGFNLITGPNGAGKTNFLEGLNLISGWGPFERSAKISNLARWTRDGERSSASLWGGVDGEERCEIFASLSIRCQLRCDDKIAGATEMRGRVPVLSFLSDHMSLMKGGAYHRRQLLDRVGALISPSYARRLYDYKHALRQKTALLRRYCDTRIVDKLLVSLGSWIWMTREEIAKLIWSELDFFVNLLAVPMDFSFERGGGGLEKNPRDDFKRSLLMKRDREKASKIPLVGPQRDDLKFFCDGIDASMSLSRGQSRRAASALMLASARLVERCLGRKPVLIFDEISSELDESGRGAILDSLLATECQVFATTTEPMEYSGLNTYKMQDGRFV
ncbi:MAG: DNA replication and repair protein RecF [Synergistaceae bacterium]|jgi:DNA replication and repair protein RecF|nr:DNA replication and repair protein RecF [Synergistaceae bacterium]